jgi:2-oxoisovalerate dehydrogenase E2 component (dihydrolipoyl transacylase)
MVQSNTIPTFEFLDEYDITELSRLRTKLNVLQGDKTKLSWLSFFIKAFSIALYDYPIVNSSY